MQVHVEPQAIEYNKREEFNLSLFRKLGTPIPRAWVYSALRRPVNLAALDSMLLRVPYPLARSSHVHTT